MKKVMNMLALAIVAGAVLAETSMLHAADENAEIARGSVVVFYMPRNDLQLDTLADQCARMAYTVFQGSGRFLPIERQRIQWAVEKIGEGPGPQAFEKIAGELRADLYCIIEIRQNNALYIAQLKIAPLVKEYAHLRKSLTVTSSIVVNLPLKLGREIAYLHKKLPLRATVVKKTSNQVVADVGQWHGITTGSYITTSGDTVNVLQTERYHSVMKIPPVLSEKNVLVLEVFPRIDPLIKKIDIDINYNTEYRYGLKNTLLKGFDPEKRYLEGLCLINVGATCVPGYGTHLAARYLGFNQVSPSIPGIVFTTTLLVSHFTLTEFMTKFKTNFFPGVRDKDKTMAIYNLQIFLWSTIPITSTVGYLDQLAYQFWATQHLPPFFDKKNLTALALSFFIPGGGLFYKGHRLARWTFYCAEMSLAGFLAYSWLEPKKRMYAAIALGGIKIIDLITALLVDPSYEFYEVEKSRKPEKLAMSLDILPDYDGGLLAFSIRYRF